MQKWISEKITDNLEHDAFHKENGISREQVWLQRTPMGTFAVVSMEVEDPGHVFHAIGNSQDPYAVGFRDLLKTAHGFDPSQAAPLNEQVVDWQAR